MTTTLTLSTQEPIVFLTDDAHARSYDVACPCSGHGLDSTCRDAGGSLVGLRHEFFCIRMTDQSPNGRSAPVTCDQNTDSHLDTDGDVRVTSQLCFPEREGAQTHLQAEHK